VFDRGWAEAYERAGGRYYPKLQIAVPFTPVTGPRLLLRRGLNQAPDAGAIVYTRYHRAINSTALITRLRLDACLFDPPPAY